MGTRIGKRKGRVGDRGEIQEGKKRRSGGKKSEKKIRKEERTKEKGRRGKLKGQSHDKGGLAMLGLWLSGLAILE